MTPRAHRVAWLYGGVVLVMVAAAIGQFVTRGTGSGSATAVQLDAVAFTPAAVTIARGSVLELRDADDGEPHFLANGQWIDGGITPAADGAGAPVLDGLEVDGGTATVGSFSREGVFPIYCEIHPGMNLVVTVTPVR
ncbi:MAG: cupredoxin domain-containing protein [Egibacteraceae bacterium]